MSRDCKKAGQSGSQQKVMVAVYNNGLRSSVVDPEDPSSIEFLNPYLLLFTISKIQNFKKKSNIL